MGAMTFPAPTHEHPDDTPSSPSADAARWLRPIPDEPSEELLVELFGEDPDTTRAPEITRSAATWWWPAARIIWMMAEAMGILYLFCLFLALVIGSPVIAWVGDDVALIPVLLLTGAMALAAIPGVRWFGVWGRREVEESLTRRHG